MTKIIAKEYVEFLGQLKEHIATSRYKAALAVNRQKKPWSVFIFSIGVFMS